MVSSTINQNGSASSGVVVYAGLDCKIYVLTNKTTLKVRNIQARSPVAMTIPFYKNIFHRLIGQASAEIHFRGHAETLPYPNEEAQNTYKTRVNYKISFTINQDTIWIKITPISSIACYGVGVNLLAMRDSKKAHRIVPPLD